MITTHVLDTATGRPGRGIPIELERAGQPGGHGDESGGAWQWAMVGSGVTDDDGRLRTLTSALPLEPGTYRLRFQTASYFEATGQTGFFPVVEIQFAVEGGQHYHVPLLLSPYGYSTYRGS